LHWANGGPSNLDNLALRRHAHHQDLHDIHDIHDIHDHQRQLPCTDGRTMTPTGWHHPTTDSPDNHPSTAGHPTATRPAGTHPTTGCPAEPHPVKAGQRSPLSRPPPSRRMEGALAVNADFDLPGLLDRACSTGLAASSLSS